MKLAFKILIFSVIILLISGVLIESGELFKVIFMLDFFFLLIFGPGLLIVTIRGGIQKFKDESNYRNLEDFIIEERSTFDSKIYNPAKYEILYPFRRDFTLKNARFFLLIEGYCNKVYQQPIVRTRFFMYKEFVTIFINIYHSDEREQRRIFVEICAYLDVDPTQRLWIDAEKNYAQKPIHWTDCSMQNIDNHNLEEISAHVKINKRLFKKYSDYLSDGKSIEERYFEIYLPEWELTFNRLVKISDFQTEMDNTIGADKVRFIFTPIGSLTILVTDPDLSSQVRLTKKMLEMAVDKVKDIKGNNPIWD